MQWQQAHSSKALYCVIGDPIKQSKSPLMLNRAFEECSIDATYGAFQVAPDQLPQFVQAVRELGILGMNVTIPHKLHVMELIDEIDADALNLGAVNTVVNRNGRLIGYNTDGIGYVRSLKEEAVANITNKKIVVVGAGGAARGIIYALLQENPSSIYVINRTVAKAKELVASLQSNVPLLAAGQAELEQLCNDADIVINTTSVGMYPHPDETPIAGHWMKFGAVASDLIYNPLKTQFLLEAEQHGCIAHGGLGMFIYQGAFAFEYWTGQTAPVEAMRETVLAVLQ
ncbi:MAG TPA: shikimate dehydrogenase [Candidatus Paenibacillus intestinavium]|nr:shikimate dehydrogenase [Candidatus Paenibacillus intestinavium]